MLELYLHIVTDKNVKPELHSHKLTAIPNEATCQALPPAGPVTPAAPVAPTAQNYLVDSDDKQITYILSEYQISILVHFKFVSHIKCRSL